MASHRPLYHRFAWAFDLVVPDASAGRVRRLAALLRAQGVRPPARVLDAGCGTGNYARALARRGYRVVGVDRSPALLRDAQARSARATSARGAPPPVFVRADLTTYRPAAPFAAALCRGVLNDVLDDGARDAVCATLSRALQPGGILLVDVRDWRRTAVRKRREPVTERSVWTPRGRLSFRSDTRLDVARRRLLLREEIRLVSRRRQMVARNAFAMRCWTWAELRWRLRRAGFARIDRPPAASVGLPADRLFAIARRAGRAARGVSDPGTPAAISCSRTRSRRP
jgi:SAM-dependent methyltransferase